MLAHCNNATLPMALMNCQLVEPHGTLDWLYLTLMSTHMPCLLLQLTLLPLQADIHDTHVSKALNPLNCLTTLTSIAYLRWASKSLLPSVPGAPLDVALAQVGWLGTLVNDQGN